MLNDTIVSFVILLRFLKKARDFPVFETLAGKSLRKEVYMGRGAKTTDFLKECMADALLQLMREKPFDKISIHEIAEKSGISRSSWFRNYTAKGEALTFKLVQLWLRWAEERCVAVRDSYTLDNAKGFFLFNYENRYLLQLIYAAGMRSAVYDAFYEILIPQFGQNAKECYQARFYSYGLFGLLDEWIKRGFYETPEDMASLFYEMMRDAFAFYHNVLLTNQNAQESNEMQIQNRQ